MGAPHKPSRDIGDLVEILRLLRSPEGCPWDKAQTNTSLIPYTLEEAYEVAEAVAQGQRYNICEELGDLLLQVVFHCQIAAEAGLFDLGDVVLAITEKLIRRHPHVFGDKKADTPDAVNRLWTQAKSAENPRAERKVPPLPGLLLLEKLAGQIDPAQAQDPFLGSLIVLSQKAKAENRCLEAEIQGFFQKLTRV